MWQWYSTIFVFFSLIDLIMHSHKSWHMHQITLQFYQMCFFKPFTSCCNKLEQYLQVFHFVMTKNLLKSTSSVLYILFCKILNVTNMSQNVPNSNLYINNVTWNSFWTKYSLLTTVFYWYIKIFVLLCEKIMILV